MAHEAAFLDAIKRGNVSVRLQLVILYIRRFHSRSCLAV